MGKRLERCVFNVVELTCRKMVQLTNITPVEKSTDTKASSDSQEQALVFIALVDTAYRTLTYIGEKGGPIPGRLI